MTDWAIDVRAGRPVLVAAAELMCALMHAGLPYRQFAFGGADWDKSFVLDGHDQLHAMRWHMIASMPGG